MMSVAAMKFENCIFSARNVLITLVPVELTAIGDWATPIVEIQRAFLCAVPRSRVRIVRKNVPHNVFKNKALSSTLTNQLCRDGTGQKDDTSSEK
jgi:hypothetical protein